MFYTLVQRPGSMLSITGSPKHTQVSLCRVPSTVGPENWSIKFRLSTTRSDHWDPCALHRSPLIKLPSWPLLSIQFSMVEHILICAISDLQNFHLCTHETISVLTKQILHPFFPRPWNHPSTFPVWIWPDASYKLHHTFLIFGCENVCTFYDLA